MTQLVIGREEHERVLLAIDFARAHPWVVDTLPEPSDPRHLVDLPFGCRCLYMHAEVAPGVLLRHLTISTAARTPPHPSVVATIARLFGFGARVAAKLDPAWAGIVHVMEPLPTGTVPAEQPR